MELLHSCSHFIYLILFTFACCCGHRTAVCCLNSADNIVHLLPPSSCWLNASVVQPGHPLIFYFRLYHGRSIFPCISRIFLCIYKYVYTHIYTHPKMYISLHISFPCFALGLVILYSLCLSVYACMHVYIYTQKLIWITNCLLYTRTSSYTQKVKLIK